MDDRRSRLYEWLFDDTNRTLLLWSAAMAFGLASLFLFFYSPDHSPTRFHLTLLVCAMVIAFYVTIRSNPL